MANTSQAPDRVPQCNGPSLTVINPSICFNLSLPFPTLDGLLFLNVSVLSRSLLKPLTTESNCPNFSFQFNLKLTNNHFTFSGIHE